MYKKGKQLLAIMLMLALCFTTASMAFAQKAGGASNAMGHMGNGGTGHGGGHGGGGHHVKNALTVKGTVVAVDTADPELPTLTVNVTHASHAQTGLVGQEVTFSIDPDAVVMVMGFGLSTLDDVLVDDVVKVMAKSVDGGYVAYKIMVY